MPYKNNNELPANLQRLPEKAQTIFRKAFNSSFASSGEDRARKIAWSAVKRKFEKKDGRWVKKMQAFVKLYSNIQALDNIDVLSKIPPQVLAKVKEKDPHPVFQIYSIAHEGISTPKILGKKSTPITWTREAIQSMAKAVRAGIKFFAGHNRSNSEVTQKELGRVVHAYQEEIDGKLHQVVIGYFPKKNLKKNYDICSQEATWNFTEIAGKLVAETCEKITGIALENSKIAKPAFSGAKRLGFVQAFESGKDEEKGAKKMNFQELKQAVIDLNVHPSQLYSLADLQKDNEFKPVFDELESVKVEKEELNKNYEGIQAEVKNLKRKADLATARKRLNNFYQEKGITEKMKKFIEESFDNDIEKFEDLSDDALSNYIENEKSLYQRVMKTVENEEVRIETGDGKQQEKKKEVDYTLPENNEFLEE